MHAVFRSPDRLLASFYSPGESTKSNLTFLSGPSGSGKTTACRRLLDAVRMQGRPVAGLLSPAVFDSSGKVGIDLLDVRTGERRRLARRRNGADQENLTGPATEDWQFDPQVLEWGDQVLSNILAEGLEEYDLLVLDELGPLEFRRGEGLATGFAVLDAWTQAARPGRLACVVVRPALVPLALARWPQAQVVDILEGSRA